MLTDQEEQQLMKLQEKAKQGIDDKELSNIENRVNDLYDYGDAVKALGIWNRHCEKLKEIARDNGVLVREIKRLRKELDKSSSDDQQPNAKGDV